MYTGIMKESAEKVAAKRKENAAFEPRRMSAEEKEAVLREYHPDHITEQFTELTIGPNKGEKAPLELAEILQGMPRIEPEKIDLTKADYETDVLIIGGGGAGTAAAIEADNAGAKVLLVTKLRVGDANTMMAEGGIQAADKANDSPERHFLDAFGGGHFDAKKELVYELVTRAPETIQWLNTLGVEFDKEKDGTMITTHGGGTSRKRMHACKDYSGAEIMRTLRDEVLNRAERITVVDFTSAVELLKDEKGKDITKLKVIATSEVKFTAKDKNGEVDVRFSFNGSELSEKDVVAFEYLYDKDMEIAKHENIEDNEQTVHFTKEEIPSKETPKGSSNTPKTGDPVKILPWIIVMVLAAGGTAFMAIKKRKNKDDDVAGISKEK